MSSSIYDRLRRDLTEAMRRRDKTATTALRTAIAAIDNARAVDIGQVQASLTNVGLSHDVTRREVDDTEMARIIEREIEEREKAIADLGAYGRVDLDELVERLRGEVEVLARYLTG